MRTYALFAVLAVSCMAGAQVANPAEPASNRNSAPVSGQVKTTPVGAELNFVLSQLEQTAGQTAMDVGRLNIKKWKADKQYKEQSQHDADSIQQNVTGTLPGLLMHARSTPDNVAVLFKVYRNVDALWDVLRGLTESAGAFGPKDEYQALANDSANLSNVRNSLAIQLDTIASTQQLEIQRLKTQLARAEAAIPPSPPKKIIVDDSEPVKKTVKKPVAKKKTTTKKTTTEKSEPPKQ